MNFSDMHRRPMMASALPGARLSRGEALPPQRNNTVETSTQAGIVFSGLHTRPMMASALPGARLSRGEAPPRQRNNTVETSTQAGIVFSDLRTSPRMADALPDPELSRGEYYYRLRAEQLEGELSVQSNLTAELEQSNAQLQQQVLQADQTKGQLQKRCSHLYDIVNAQLKERRGNNAEIALLRGQLKELRGQHQRLLAERLQPVANLPDEPKSAAWAGMLGGGPISGNIPRGAAFQNFDFPERQQRPSLSRGESSDLSPAEREVIRTRMLTDRGPGRRSSCNDGGVHSPHGEADREEGITNPSLPERATRVPSRGVKVEASARAPEEVDGSLPPRRGNDDAPQRNPTSSPLPSEACSMRLRGSKGWHAGVCHQVKREPDTSDDEPPPSGEGPNAATPDPELGDQEERGEQREGHGCEETGDKVYAGEGPRATSSPPVAPAGSECSPRSSASCPMEIASPHTAIPHNGVLSDGSVESHGPVHDGSKPSAHQPIVQRGAAVAASSSPTLASAAVSQGASADEGPGVLAPSPAGLAEPQPMEVVASSASSNGSISSEPSDALPASAPSASSFRRNIGHPPLREACPDSTTQIDPLEASPAEETAAADSDGPSKSAGTRRANTKAPKVETCVPSDDGRTPLAPAPVLDRYLYVTYCSVCGEPRVERQAVALCELCPRMFCGVCAASLGQTVDPAPGASDVLLPGDNCVCLQRDLEFPKPPTGVRPEAHLLEHLIAHNLSLQFREPVDVQDNPGYLGVITRSEMMDLGTMKENMRRNRYETARGQRQFRLDVKQIWLNCWKFAGCPRGERDAPLPGIVSCALILERMVGKFCDAHMQGEEELFDYTAGNRFRRERFVRTAPNATPTPEESEEEPEFEDSDEETESEPEPEMIDVLPPTDALPGRKRKAPPDSPPTDGMEISSDANRGQGCGSSPAKKTQEPAESLCSLAGIGEKLLKGID